MVFAIIFDTSRLSIGRVAVILLCHTYTVVVAEHNCKRAIKILYIRLNLLKLCCNEIVIMLVFKKRFMEVIEY